MDEKQFEKLIKELDLIKKLLVVTLLNSKIKATSLAQLVNMDKGDFSRMFPVKKLLNKSKDDNVRKK